MGKSDFDSRIEELNKMIERANNIVFFGGAGVSTESGIPDFRSKNGLYNQHDVRFEKYDAEYLLSHECLFNNPKVFYEFYKQKMDCRSCEPNITHKVLAKMEDKGKLLTIITQNIDGLHEKAGNKKIINLHGTINKVYCHKCGMEYHPDFLFETQQAIPKCECRGLIRPDVVLYGEDLPDGVLFSSSLALSVADLLIVGGTSLTVSPANMLLNFYHGNDLIIINKEETQFDNYANLIFRENIGEVFSKVVV